MIRSLTWGLAAVVVSAAVGCGTDEPTQTSSDHNDSSADSTDDAGVSATPAADGSGDEFCSQVDGIGAELTLLTSEDVADPAQYPDQISQAAERFTTLEPPEGVVESWRHVADFLVMVEDALDGVDVSSAEDLDEALTFDSDSFATVIQLPGHVESVGVFVQDACDVDLGITAPAISNVCDIVDPTHLGSAFDNAVPAGEHRAWGGGVVECLWGDTSGPEVGVVVGPAEFIQTDIVAMAEIVDTANFGDATIEVYDCAVGPHRSRGGRTAVIAVDQTSGLASVATGDASAEAEKAIALVGMISGELE